MMILRNLRGSTTQTTSRRPRQRKLQKRPRTDATDIDDNSTAVASDISSWCQSSAVETARSRSQPRKKHNPTERRRSWLFFLPDDDPRRSVLDFKAIRYPPETVSPAMVDSQPPWASQQQTEVNWERPTGEEYSGVLPEFRHLRDASGGVEKANATRRGSDDREQEKRLSVSTIRQTAKTPVFAIGDLEAAHSGADQRRLRGVAKSPANDSRCHPRQWQRQRRLLRHQRSYSQLPKVLAAAAAAASAWESDDSDDPRATTVFTSWPRRRDELRGRNDNLGLQICLDLLTEELMAAADDASQNLGNDMTRLEVWLMIEAFERLKRDMLQGLRRQQQQARHETGDENDAEEESVAEVEHMMSVWIGALQRFYDVLDSERRSSPKPESGLRRSADAGLPGVE